MKVLVIAPHPDDEVLGCGGTTASLAAAGHEVSLLVVTGPPRDDVVRAASILGTRHIKFLEFEPARLDEAPTQQIVDLIRNAVNDLGPLVVYLPHGGDAHSDHRVVRRAAAATCTKWFRCRTVRRVLAYETSSETEFGFDPTLSAFRPNVFVNIGAHMDRKIAAMGEYAGEMGRAPFPRSPTVVRALAAFRGSTAGYGSAEAFEMIKEVSR